MTRIPPHIKKLSNHQLLWYCLEHYNNDSNEDSPLAVFELSRRLIKSGFLKHVLDKNTNDED